VREYFVGSVEVVEHVGPVELLGGVEGVLHDEQGGRVDLAAEDLGGRLAERLEVGGRDGGRGLREGAQQGQRARAFVLAVGLHLN